MSLRLIGKKLPWLTSIGNFINDSHNRHKFLLKFCIEQFGIKMAAQQTKQNDAELNLNNLQWIGFNRSWLRSNYCDQLIRAWYCLFLFL